MIQTALMRPSAIASNMSTALSPALSAMTGDCQNRCTVSRCAGVVELHVGGELVGEPADLAAAHRVGLAGERERPHARAADAAGQRDGS